MTIFLWKPCFYTKLPVWRPNAHRLRCGCESNPCLYLEHYLYRKIELKLKNEARLFWCRMWSRINRCMCLCLTRSVCFSAVPSAPYGISLLSCDGASMTLAWKRPKHTGGSKITSYYLDKRDADSVMWKEVSSRPATSRVYKVCRK